MHFASQEIVNTFDAWRGPSRKIQKNTALPFFPLMKFNWYFCSSETSENSWEWHIFRWPLFKSWNFKNLKKKVFDFQIFFFIKGIQRIKSPMKQSWILGSLKFYLEFCRRKCLRVFSASYLSQSRYEFDRSYSFIITWNKRLFNVRTFLHQSSASRQSYSTNLRHIHNSLLINVRFIRSYDGS